MKYAKVFSVHDDIFSPSIVEIETDISIGLFYFSIIGMTDRAVEESKDRVISAIKNSGFPSPKTENHKIVISLAPAYQKKGGTHFDMAIAISYLKAVGLVPKIPDKTVFMGELSLDGEIRPVQNLYRLLYISKNKGMKNCFVPEQGIGGVDVFDDLDDTFGGIKDVDGIDIYTVKNLKDLVHKLHSFDKIREMKASTHKAPSLSPKRSVETDFIDFKDVLGHHRVKRALTIAAAGGHHILLFGPAGSGKTMLARATAHILPDLSKEQALSINYQQDYSLRPPFRSPHHTSSYSVLIGSAGSKTLGECILAHDGILFLDEFVEFDRRAIEALRQPLEERYISLIRQGIHKRYQTDFICIASMNPCPCGNSSVGSSSVESPLKPQRDRFCNCSPHLIEKYRRKVSGPIFDRFDIKIEVGYEGPTTRADDEADIIGVGIGVGVDTLSIREVVAKVRDIQKERYKGYISESEPKNATVASSILQKEARIEKEAEEVLHHISLNKRLSTRTYMKILRVARTIADIDGKSELSKYHILEALMYSSGLDKFY